MPSPGVMFAILALVAVIVAELIYDFGDNKKEICALSPSGYRIAFQNCKETAKRVSKALKGAGVPSQSVEVSYWRGGEFLREQVEVWPLPEKPDYFTSDDGSGNLYRRKFVTSREGNRHAIIQPLYMGMIHGKNEFDDIDAALLSAPARYHVPFELPTAA